MISNKLLIELQYSSLTFFTVLTNNVVRLVKKLDEKNNAKTCGYTYRK